MRSEIKTYAAMTQFGRGVEIRIFSETGRDGELSVGKPVVFETVDEGLFTEPTIRLRMNEAQAMMDALWGCGLRPTEGSGSAGALAATERHLKDMQTITFGLLKKEIE